MATLGERIRTKREAVGLTQHELAEQIGVLANSVSRWERDCAEPQGPAKKWLREKWPEVYVETDRTGTAA
jgi:DNA-binding transcriptional regulator YiaG